MSPAHNDIRVLAASRNSRPFVDDTGQGKVSRRRPKAMEIRRSGSQPSGKGPAEYFSGTVRIDPLFDAHEPARVRAASVTFEPGARTAWHTHPLGQTLIVTSGLGWAQRWSGPVEEIRPGDVTTSVSLENAFWVALGEIPAVPEPSTWAMLVIGFAGLGFVA